MKLHYHNYLRYLYILLYIPHGSDETYVLDEDAVYSEYFFISHTVQMKLLKEDGNFYIEIDFISHTVQMKPRQ